MEHRRGISREQSSLFPVRFDDLIPGDHPIRVIDLYVDQLDLSALGFSKVQVSSQGRPPYHPGDLLKLYLYGYLNRVRSSRRLEAECQRNMEVMWLLGRLVPDHKTIANFRKDEGEGIQGVCRGFVQFCRRMGLLGGTLVAIDGSKFQAVASRQRTVTAEELARREAGVQAQIARYLAELDQADRQEEPALERRAVQTALATLQAQKEAIDAKRAIFKSTRRTCQIDGEPEARLVKGGQGRHMAGYNLQSAVDSEHKLIVHHEVVSEGNDLNQLLPMAQAAKNVLGQATLTVVADAGYSNGEHLAGCEAAGITPYVRVARAVNTQGDGTLFDRRLFHYDEATDTFRCPAGARLIRKQQNRTERNVIYAGVACGACPLKSQCTTAAQRYVSRHLDEASFARVEQRLAREPHIMQRRKAIVEHPFANLKRWIFGDGRYLVRGLHKVRTETALAVLTYNVRRVMNVLGVQRMKQYLIA